MLEPNQKIILSTIYVSQLDGTDPIEKIKEKTTFSEDEINSKIDDLIKNQLVNEDKTLTESGRNSLKVVLAGGVFDIIHPGHIYTLNAAKNLGDVLVVVVATDNTAVKMKKRQPLHSQEQRQELVNSLSTVDLCLIGQEDDIFKTVNNVRPQIIALGYDQKFTKRNSSQMDVKRSILMQKLQDCNLQSQIALAQKLRKSMVNPSTEFDYGLVVKT